MKVLDTWLYVQTNCILNALFVNVIYNVVCTPCEKLLKNIGLHRAWYFWGGVLGVVFLGRSLALDMVLPPEQHGCFKSQPIGAFRFRRHTGPLILCAIRTVTGLKRRDRFFFHGTRTVLSVSSWWFLFFRGVEGSICMSAYHPFNEKNGKPHCFLPTFHHLRWTPCSFHPKVTWRFLFWWSAGCVPEVKVGLSMVVSTLMPNLWHWRVGQKYKLPAGPTKILWAHISWRQFQSYLDGTEILVMEIIWASYAHLVLILLRIN